MMPCPTCGGDTAVLETRNARRRRECVACGVRLVTTEIVTSGPGEELMVVRRKAFTELRDCVRQMEKR